MVINKLLKLANYLDQKGEYKLANEIDLIAIASDEDERREIEKTLLKINKERDRNLTNERIQELYTAETNAKNRLSELQSSTSVSEDQVNLSPDDIMNSYFSGDVEFDTGDFIRELRNSWRYWRDK